MKTTNLKLGIVTVIMSLAFVNCSKVQAQKSKDRKEPPTFEQLLKDMDKNEDGKLAKSELKGPLKDDFAKVDTDEDGFISAAEFKKAPKPKRRKRPQVKN